jgi:DNA modification methylase
MIDLNKLYNEDCRETMKRIPDNSIDSIVTDPPYGISFMGKAWDTFSPEYLEVQMERESKRRPRTDGRKATGFQGSVYAGFYDLTPKGMAAFQLWYYEIAKEFLRILKPGGHLLSFGSTRTSHRMVCAIEDAGFEIRDTLMWIYGSGFPKSLDVSKAIDKEAGIKRKVIGKRTDGRYASMGTDITSGNLIRGKPGKAEIGIITEPATTEAEKFEGWGTALKPAVELICLARKPISEKTVAKNVLKWGTGAINIDECRIDSVPDKSAWFANRKDSKTFHGDIVNNQMKNDAYKENQGRFPANIILDQEAAELLDKQSGKLKSGPMLKPYPYTNNSAAYGKPSGSTKALRASNEGFASRFFYIAKTSPSERHAGCYELERERDSDRTKDDGLGDDNPRNRSNTAKNNSHPTVKPIDLMQYLCRLVTPKGGLIYDPFAGSGTTPIAATNEGFYWVASEKIKKHWDIAIRRIHDNCGLFL